MIIPSHHNMGLVDQNKYTITITLFNQVTKLGGARNMSCTVLELYVVDTCL